MLQSRPQRIRVLGVFSVVRILLMFAIPHAGIAQSTGTVTGAVSDSSAAIIPAVTVQLRHDLTGVSFETKSNEEGIYRFVQLQPGSYTLSATHTAFDPVRVTAIAVEVNRVTRVDVVLPIAATREFISVTAESTLIDYDTGTKGQIVTERQLESLALQTRNPLAVMMLTPGVVTREGNASFNRPGSDGANITSRYNINGGIRTGTGGYQEYVVDGISVTNLRDGSILALPAADALQEFRVQSGAMSAEYGHTVGGVVNFVTKGGNNEFHGNLFYAHRSTATQTRLALPATAAKPPNVYNQFGGTVGGPIARNRSFFFFGWDSARWIRKFAQVTTIPTLKMRAGDFSEISGAVFDPASASSAADRTPFPNNQIPVSQFNSFGEQMLRVYPEPNRGVGRSSNFQGIFGSFVKVDNMTARVDHVLSDRQKLLFKVTRVRSDADSDKVLGLHDPASQFIKFPSHNLTANYSYTLSPSLLFSASAGYTKWNRQIVDLTRNTQGTSLFGYSITPALEEGNILNLTPRANFDGFSAIGSGFPQNFISENFQINPALSWVKGEHSMRFGADLRRQYLTGLIATGVPNGSWSFSASQTGQGTAGTGHSVASGLLGLPNGVTIQRQPLVRVHQNPTALYIVDDFKVLPTLTLNLGLRWEGVGPLLEQNNQVGWLDTTSVNSIVSLPGVFQYAGSGGNSRNIRIGNYNNWSPRFGFAYSPSRLGGTVIRGGFGVYYSPIPTSGYFGAAPGFETTFSPTRPSSAEPALVLRGNYELPPADGPRGEAAYLGLGFTNPLNRQLGNPRIYQWNVGVQRELWRNTLLEILYTGNRGSRLLSNRNHNLAPESLIQEAVALQEASGQRGDARTFLDEKVPNPLAGLVPGTLGAATITRERASHPFPQYGGTGAFQNNRDSIYHAMQLTFQRRFSGGLAFLVGYTLSKEIDNVSASASGNIRGREQNPYNLRDARAVGAYDRPHNLVANLVYDSPFGSGGRYSGNKALNILLGRLQITSSLMTQSGAPLAVRQSASNGLPGSQRPDLLTDAGEASRSVRGTVASNGNLIWTSPDAYSLVDGRYGTAPIRDAHNRGPSFFLLDLGLHRDFPLTEQIALRIRIQAFNSLNHPNLRNPQDNVNSSSFGQISAVHDPRIWQFGAEIRF